VANPDYRPGFKISRQLKSFSEDGVEINLYFYEGDWPGQRAVIPFTIGRMKIVSLIEGRETPALAALRRDVGQILEREKTAFETAH
jgi:hypothetical protein